MKRILSLRIMISLSALLLTITFLSAPTVNAQIPIGISTPLHRFVIPSSNYRTFLTTDIQEGNNLGYLYWDQVGSILLPPGPGWTPNPGQGLVPMYRWRVDHTSGTNYYYSGGIWPNLLANPENHFEGLKGYALIPSVTAGGPGFFLHLWYSQSDGYFYASNGSATIPPNHPSGYWGWQGVAFRLPIPVQGPFANCTPQLGCYLFSPPPPPPSCDATQEQSCYNNGGTWNSSNCSCTYPPPDPCRPGPGLIKWKDMGDLKDNERAPMCRPSLP